MFSVRFQVSIDIVLLILINVILIPHLTEYPSLVLSKGGMMKCLLGAHVESSHTSTQIHGRYFSADAHSADAESKKYLYSS
jgi:hypothetical protein